MKNIKRVFEWIFILALAAVLADAVLMLTSPREEFRLPGHNQGFAPVQPVAFSHALHAGTLGIACLYCHSGAERSPVAGIPPLQTCLGCHRFVTHASGQTGVSPELRKLYDAAGLGPDLRPIPGRKPHPIQWVRVDELPGFVRFDHSRHVLAGVSCQTCHGPVQDMDRVRQVRTLDMGMCINCHRAADKDGIDGKKVHASLDCSVCHY